MNAITDTPVRLRQIADLPHPPMSPVRGNAGQLDRARVHQTVEKWAQQYGKLFRMRFGRVNLLVVADHALLAEVMRDRPDGWKRNPRTKDISQELGLPRGVFSAEGEEWKAQRRIVMASFAPGNIRAYFSQMTKVTERLQTRWLKAAHSGKALPLQSELMRYTVDTIAGLALGDDINTLEAGEDVIQQHLDKVLPAVFRRAFTPFPYWRWFKRKADRELDRSVATINTEIARFVAQARAQLRDQPSLREKPRNLLQAMIVAAEADGGLADDAIAGNVLTMLLAGEDTTANTLAWLINLLHRHPQTMQRARQEVHSVLGAAAGKPQAFTLELMDSLPYLDACINEAMRLKPVAPFIGLQALRDTQIADVHVPKDTLLWGVLRHDSMGEAHFPKPELFDPQRWLAADAVDGATVSAANPNAASASAKRVAMPFGAGPRICPGRYLALLEMKLAMSMLLSRFTVTAVDTPDGLEAKELLQFTMAPMGLMMKLAA